MLASAVSRALFKTRDVGLSEAVIDETGVKTNKQTNMGLTDISDMRLSCLFAIKNSK